MKISILNPFVVLLAAALSLSGTAFALNYQWDVNGGSAGLGGTGTWNSTNAFWDSTASGANDGTEVTTAPTFSGSDTAIFGGTAGAVTVAAVTVGGLNFTSSGYNLSSGTINMGANTTILQTTSTSANTTTISSKISGAFKLTLNATSYSQYANLTLSGANDYSGGTDIAHNTQVTIGNATAFGTGTVTVTSASFFSKLSASSALTIANNFVLNNNFGLNGSNNITTSGTLNLGGGAPRTIDVSTSRIFRFNGNTSNGALTKTGAGILTLAGGSSYTGATVIAASGGTLRIRNSSSSSGFSIASGTDLQLNNISLSSTQNITGAGNVSTDGGVFGDLTLNGTNNNYTGSTTANISKIIVGATGVINGTSSISVLGSNGAQFENLGSVTTPGAVTVNGSSNVADGLFNNGNGTLVGSLTAGSINLQSSFISNATSAAHGGEFNNKLNSTVNLGSGAITVNGQGNTLAGGSAASGSTFSNAGSVTAGSITLNSSSTANTASNKGGTYSQTGGSTTLTGTATLSANGGAGAAGTAGNDAAFNLSGGTFSAGTLAVNSGTVTATGGTLNLGSGGITSSGTNTIAVNLGATTVGATTAWTSSVAMNLTNSTTGTTFNTTGGNIGLSGGLSGTGKLVKSGTGTLTLSNTNNYSGATAVNAGALAVNGTLANTTTTVTSATSARLQGSGSIGGSVTVGDKGTIAAGNSIESLGVGGLALTGGSTFEHELSDNSSTGADLVYSAGNLSLAGTVTLDLVKLGSYAWQVDDKLTLISYTGALTANSLFSFTDGNDGLLADGETFSFDGAQWVFDYDDTLKGTNFAGDANGSYVTMTVIPEPRAALLGSLGLLALLRRRR